MEVKIKTLPKSEVEINVIIPFLAFEPYVKRAAIVISEETEIEGFRRGKAPFAVVKEKVGEAAIYEKAANMAVRRSYLEVLEKARENKSDEEFLPIGRPEVVILKVAPENDLEYKIKIALFPKVALSDYKDVARRAKKEKKEIAVDEKEITKALEWIRESRAPLVTVDREARKDDRVEIDFEVRHGGVKIEGGESKDHPLILGKGKFLPGFEDKLVGMKTGEEKEFNLVAPEDWHEKNFAGKSLDFKIMMKLVQERSLPEVDDEFAKGLGKFENIESLKRNLREGIAQEKEEKERQRIRSLLVEEIAAGIRADLPEVLVESELDKMFTELKSGVDGMGLKWEDYLMHVHPVREKSLQAPLETSFQEKTASRERGSLTGQATEVVPEGAAFSNGVKKAEEALKAGWRGEAEKRVRAALALRYIANKENINVTPEEIEARASQFLRQFGAPEEARAIDPTELREHMRGVIRNEKVFEFLENL